MPWTEESSYVTSADKESCAQVLQQRLHDDATFRVSKIASTWEVVIREQLPDDSDHSVITRCERGLAPKMTVELLQFDSTQSQLRCTIGIDQSARETINAVGAIVIIPLFPLLAFRDQYFASNVLLGLWMAALMSYVFLGLYLYPYALERQKRASAQYREIIETVAQQLSAKRLDSGNRTK